MSPQIPLKKFNFIIDNKYDKFRGFKEKERIKLRETTYLKQTLEEKKITVFLIEFFFK